MVTHREKDHIGIPRDREGRPAKDGGGRRDGGRDDLVNHSCCKHKLTQFFFVFNIIECLLWRNESCGVKVAHLTMFGEAQTMLMENKRESTPVRIMRYDV